MNLSDLIRKVFADDDYKLNIKPKKNKKHRMFESRECKIVVDKDDEIAISFVDGRSRKFDGSFTLSEIGIKEVKIKILEHLTDATCELRELNSDDEQMIQYTRSDRTRMYDKVIHISIVSYGRSMCALVVDKKTNDIMCANCFVVAIVEKVYNIFYDYDEKLPCDYKIREINRYYSTDEHKKQTQMEKLYTITTSLMCLPNRTDGVACGGMIVAESYPIHDFRHIVELNCEIVKHLFRKFNATYELTPNNDAIFTFSPPDHKKFLYGKHCIPYNYRLQYDGDNIKLSLSCSRTACYFDQTGNMATISLKIGDEWSEPKDCLPVEYDYRNINRLVRQIEHICIEKT